MVNKSVSGVVVGTLVAVVEGLECPDLHTNVGLVVEIGFLGDTADDEKGNFPVGFLVALLLLLLLLLNDLNLELDFVADADEEEDVVADDDDSFEDPDSGSCAFLVPAFNG